MRMLAAALAIFVTSSLAGPAPTFQLPTPQAVPDFLQSSLKCGIAPIPPVGCKVGACVCDSSGMRCEWSMVCS